MKATKQVTKRLLNLNINLKNQENENNRNQQIQCRAIYR